MFDADSMRGLFYALAAGLATGLGALFICFVRGKSDKIVAVTLGFAAGVMISASFADLFPEAEEMLSAFFGEGKGTVLSVAFMLAGIVLAALMDKIMPHSHVHDDGNVHGSVHGHDHEHHEHGHEEHDESENLKHVGIATAVAIGLHNLPEGIAIFMAGYEDAALGIAIAVAIALHNIPGGIAVASPIYYATGSRKSGILYALLAGLAEPLGALIACILLRPLINDGFLGAVFGIVSGVLLYIAFVELLPASRGRGYDKQALIAMFAGILLIPLTHIAHLH